jgi:PAS domain S-box-containing protein
MNTNTFVSEEFPHNLFALTRDATLITDLQRKILFASHTVERMFGYSPNQLVDHPLDILLLQEDLTYLLPNIYKITQERGNFQGEVLLVSRTGDPLYGHLAAYLYPGNGRQPNVVILTIHDVSMIKELEKNYLEFRKLTSLGRMTERIVYEMRTPILSMSGFAERMDHSLPQDSPLRKYLTILRKEILSLETIITQLEEFASLPQPEYKKEDLVEVIQALIEEFQPLGKEREVRLQLKISLPSEERTLYMDQSLLHKALKVLLNTTLESLSMDGNLSLCLHSNADYFMIDILSNGSDTSPTDIGAIFDSFFTSKPQMGKIHLIAAHRIIEEQGGKLETFINPGEGVFYRVSLLKERRRKIRTQSL